MKITVNVLRIVALIFYSINAFSQIEKCGTMYVFEQQVSFQFDMADNPAGVYFIKIKSNDGSIVKKFVLQK